MQLKEFQVNFINNIYGKLRSGVKNLACVAPTGAGKTVVMSKIAVDALNAGKTFLILVHLDVLVPQTLDKLYKFGISEGNIGCIKCGYPENRFAPIQVASLQTLVKRRWWRTKNFDVIVYDEAHITTFSTIGKKIRHELYPENVHLGFTATPRRLSKTEGMQTHYSDSVLAALPSELQESGMLSYMKYYAFSGANLDKVRIQHGDYHLSDLQVACNHPDLIEDIIKHWKDIVPGRKTLAFCVNIDHAENVRKAFQSHGIKSEVVTGNTPIKERTRLYQALDQGDITVLTSVNVVSIGFDLPSVEVGLGLRPTKSWAMHMQQIGRIMRVSKGKNFGYWLDQAGNLKLGLPEDLTANDYALDTAKEPGEGDAPIRICEQCGCVNRASAKVCQECGFEFPRVEKMTTPGEFIEILIPEKDRSKPEQFYRRKLKEAYRKGYDPGWAMFKFKDEYDYYPKGEWRLHAVFLDTKEESMEKYFNYLERLKEGKTKGTWFKKKDNNWLVSEFVKEFGKEHKQYCIRQVFDRIPSYV